MHPPYEIFAVTAKRWLLEESSSKLMLLYFEDEFLSESSTPLVFQLTVATF